MVFDGLDRDTRAVALVGYFLQEFALAEEQVTSALALLLGLSEVQRELLLDGMPVGHKFKALKELAPELPEHLDRVSIAKCASDLLKANTGVRVHLAHRRFEAGIKDLVIVKPGWKDEVLAAWTADEFIGRINVIVATRRPLLHLTEALGVMATDRLFRDFAAKLADKLSASRTLFQTEEDI